MWLLISWSAYGVPFEFYLSIYRHTWHIIEIIFQRKSLILKSSKIIGLMTFKEKIFTYVSQNLYYAKNGVKWPFLRDFGHFLAMFSSSYLFCSLCQLSMGEKIKIRIGSSRVVNSLSFQWFSAGIWNWNWTWFITPRI